MTNVGDLLGAVEGPDGGNGEWFLETVEADVGEACGVPGYGMVRVVD